MTSTLTQPPKRRVTPDHLHNTVYPFFWVQPVEHTLGIVQVLDSWDDAITYGLYRYDKPNASDGISFSTWIADFEELETADAVCSAMNLVRDLQQSSVSLPDIGDIHENLEIARTLLV